MSEQRLIDANLLVEKLQADYAELFRNAGQKVRPEDYYIKRREIYNADLFKAEIDGFCDLINSQPTVKAVPVVEGEWSEERDGDHWYHTCSVCMESPLVDRRDALHFNCEESLTDFCPHCGAKMRKGDRDG